MFVLQNCQESITFLLLLTEYKTREMQLMFQGLNPDTTFLRTLRIN